MKRSSPKNPVARGRDIITCIKMWSWRLNTKDFCSKSHKSICFYYIFLPGFWPNKSCSAHVFLYSQTEARTNLEVHHSRGGAKDQPEPIDRRNRSTKRLTGRKWDEMLWPKTLEKYRLAGCHIFQFVKNSEISSANARHKSWKISSLGKWQLII